MDFERYMKKTRETAVYPKDYERDYVIHGLVDELGELLETIKNNNPGPSDSSLPMTSQPQTEEICKEMGDCTWYLARLADHFDIELESLWSSAEKRREYARGEQLVFDALLAAARINGHQKKSVRDDSNRESGIKAEAQKIFKNLQSAAHHLGLYNLDVVLETNLDKLFDRKDRGKLHGDGDNR